MDDFSRWSIDFFNDMEGEYQLLRSEIDQILDKKKGRANLRLLQMKSKRTQMGAKRKKAVASGGMQRSTGANTAFYERTD
jgi:hypothetical protein